MKKGPGRRDAEEKEDEKKEGKKEGKGIMELVNWEKGGTAEQRQWVGPNTLFGVFYTCVVWCQSER